MRSDFHELLSNLKNTSALISSTNPDAGPGKASAHILFSNGTNLRADYWRLLRPNNKPTNIRNDNEPISSFDRQLSDDLDAIGELRTQLENKSVIEAYMDQDTGDLHFHFANNIKLQVFTFCGSDVWEFRFADRSREDSTYVFE